MGTSPAMASIPYEGDVLKAPRIYIATLLYCHSSLHLSQSFQVICHGSIIIEPKLKFI